MMSDTPPHLLYGKNKKDPSQEGRKTSKYKNNRQKGKQKNNEAHSRPVSPE